MRDAPDNEHYPHAIAWVLKLCPRQTSATIAFSQEGVLRDFVQACSKRGDWNTIKYFGTTCTRFFHSDPLESDKFYAVGNL